MTNHTLRKIKDMDSPVLAYESLSEDEKILMVSANMSKGVLLSANELVLVDKLQAAGWVKRDTQGVLIGTPKSRDVLAQYPVEAYLKYYTMGYINRLP